MTGSLDVVGGRRVIGFVMVTVDDNGYVENRELEIGCWIWDF